ncbi:MAG TPA: PKD domain-containing protein [Solirubrobacteraceae bacterium]
MPGLVYQGGPIMRSSHVHIIFWQPSTPPAGVSPFSSSPVSYQAALGTYFDRLAHDSGLPSNVFSVATQYYEIANGAKSYASYAVSFSPTADTYTDTKSFPPTATTGLSCTDLSDETLSTPLPVCLTARQLAEEIVTAINSKHWTAGPESIFFIYTPKGVGSCFSTGENSATTGNSCAYTGEQGYCAYHDAFSFGAGNTEVIFANMPYGATPACDDGARPEGSDAGPVINSGSHEHNESVTDPTGEGWWDSIGSETANADYGYENGDLCVTSDPSVMYGPLLSGSTQYGTSGAFNQLIGNAEYLLQREWSDSAGGCEQRLPAVAFTPPTSLTTGQTATLEGNASTDSAASQITKYEWTFADSNTTVDGPDSASSQSVTHSFCAPGSYEVKLTAEDAQGDPASVSHPLTVTGTNLCSSPGSLTTTASTTSASTLTQPSSPQAPATSVSPSTTAPGVQASASSPTAYSAAQIAGLLGLPRNGSRLRVATRARLGHARCAPACSLTMSLYLYIRLSHHGLRRQIIGSLQVTLARGQLRVLVVHLNRAGRALLRRHKRLPVSLSVAVSDPQGHSWNLSRKLILAPAPRRSSL